MQSIGIIVNELLTNITKYAFMGKTLTEQIGGTITLDRNHGTIVTIEFKA